MTALYVLAAVIFTPALFWLLFLARRDLNREPASLLLRTFAWGGVMLLPGVALESFTAALPLAVLTVGLIEEVAKFVAARTAVSHRGFDHPSDGIVYAAAAALGFATLENILYALSSGGAVLLVRLPVTTVAHLLFSIPWGHAMGAARFGSARWLPAAGLVAGALMHSLFNALLYRGLPDWQWLLIPFPAIVAVIYALAGRYYGSVRLAPARRAGPVAGKLDALAEPSPHP
jgi:RsiW-degrading membrane proteinase PrsW (M82 family)